MRYALAVGSTNSEAILDLTSGAGLLVANLVGIVRFIRNAILVRIDYTTALEKLGAAAPATADPTKDFLGEKWWTLPTTVLGMVAAVWSALEYSGVAKQLVELSP